MFRLLPQPRSRSRRADFRTLAFVLFASSLSACETPGDRVPEREPDLSRDAASQDTTADQTTTEDQTPTPKEPTTLRVATFNVSMSQFEAPGELARSLEEGQERFQDIAEIIQRVRPDILLLNEFDHDASGEALTLFHDRYLSVAQADQEAIGYDYRYIPQCNTGELADIDLDGDGSIDLPNDAYGFGRYKGQYCMVVLSRYPIAQEEIRTFQTLLWRDMPDAMLPVDHYSEEARQVFRLSSKTHADIPIDVSETRIHLLVSHPTPPVFDGPEDRNGRRNHDEIRLWADYLVPDKAGYIRDDAGAVGGLEDAALFVIAGDLNADPTRGDSVPEAIDQLLKHPRVNAEMPPSDSQTSTVTSSFGLRVDYVLPATGLELRSTGIFSPTAQDPLARLVDASDHRLVWIEIAVP
jgi:endonuclease/exonuclease/phosphatase family metal-dependent hydrolase